jgi:teichuronic acid biosynthesis glycosyltransferase TuaG
VTISDTSVPVSVVVPCYRCACTVRRAVSSICEQTHQPAEIILVDDASGDETLTTLREIENQYFGLVKVVALEKNVGAASARNAGWAVASQPFVAFLDADDSWHPDKLRLQCGFMQNNPHVVLSGHQCLWIKEGELPIPIPRSWSETKINPRRLLFKNSFSTPTVMLRRDVAFRFQDGRRYAEDFLLWLRISHAGFEVSRMEVTLAYVHKPFYGSSGLSSAAWNMERAELENFYILHRAGDIGLFLYLAASVFSLLKFILRVFAAKLIS